MAQGQIDRQHAALLMADVVGYSHLMEFDETGTLQALQEHIFSVVNPTIGEFEGRIVKTMGDGFLAKFGDVVRATECAICLQTRMIERTLETPEAERIRFRIAIHSGEVLATDDDVFGEDVNITARLQELCTPEGVCVSGTVHSQIEGVVDATFEDIGAHRLKNMAKPVRAYIFNPRQPEEPIRGAFRPFVDLPVKEAPMITGGCLCGKIRYEISEPGLGSLYCHCRMCRAWSGAPIVAGATFKAEAVKFTEGQVKYYKSSGIGERGFCSDCGSSICFRGLVGTWTEWILIYTGGIKNPQDFIPTYHLGVESSVPWLVIQDELPRTKCKDSPSLIEAYHKVGEEVP